MRISEFEEKRFSSRERFRIEIIYLIDKNFFVGYMKDISINGLYIETHNLCDEGRVLFIDFYLPDIPDKFKLKGKVIRVDKEDGKRKSPGMGIEFIDIPEEKVKLIDHWINHSKNLKPAEL